MGRSSDAGLNSADLPTAEVTGSLIVSRLTLAGELTDSGRSEASNVLPGVESW